MKQPNSKVLMMAMPPLMILPGITSILALPWWMWLPAFAVIVMCEIGAACAFFPVQTVHRYKRWRQYKHALHTGNLYPQDVERLLARHAPSRPASSDACAVSVSTRLVRLASTRAWESHTTGQVVVRWVRKRDDLALLADALKVGLPAEALLAHVNGTRRLDADALCTMAALRDEPQSPYIDVLRRAGTMQSLYAGSPTAPSVGAVTAPTHCQCPLAHT